MISATSALPKGLARRPLGRPSTSTSVHKLPSRQHVPLQPRHNVPRRTSQPLTIAKAQPGQQGSEQQPPPETHQNSSGVVTAAGRQLLSVTALAFFTLVATVARDRVTSPIVPPLIPHLETASSSSADGASISCSSSSTHRGVTVTFEAAEPAANTNKAQPVKPSRSLLRLVWGTATLPVKLMDAVLFPEEALVGSSSTTKQETSTASAPSAAQQRSTRGTSTTSKSSNNKPSSSQQQKAAPVAAVAAAVSERLQEEVAVDKKVLATTTTGLEAATGALQVSTTGADMLQQLQEVWASIASKVAAATGSTDTSSASTSTSTTSNDHTAAAALAAVRVLMGKDGNGLLPVLLVTSATAVAGLMLAASMAGLAGLVDRRRATTPAQRAAQAALLDSPLRPICCYTWPGFLPMLPASIGPNYYRWRDTGSSPDDSAGTAVELPPGAAKGAAATTTDTPPALQAAMSTQEEEAQEWWSFAQVAALRMMPLLPTSRQAAGSSSSSAAVASTSTAPAGVAASAAAQDVDAGAAAATTASTTGEPAQFNATEFEQLRAELSVATARCLEQAGRSSNILATPEASALLGPAWDLAMQLAACDTLASYDVSWDLARSFARSAPVELLAEVCCLLPAAVVNCRAALGSSMMEDSEDEELYESSWQQVSRLLAVLLSRVKLPKLEAVAQAMGLVGTAEEPSSMHGYLQACCHSYQAQAEQLSRMGTDAPGVQAASSDGQHSHSSKAQQQLQCRAVALGSSIMGAYAVRELWQMVATMADNTPPGMVSGDSGAGTSVQLSKGRKAAAKTISPQWLEPRRVLCHAELVERLLLAQQKRPGMMAPAALASDILSASSPCATGDALVEHPATRLSKQHAAAPRRAADLSADRLTRYVALQHTSMLAQMTQEQTMQGALQLGFMQHAQHAWDSPSTAAEASWDEADTEAQYADDYDEYDAEADTDRKEACCTSELAVTAAKAEVAVTAAAAADVAADSASACKQQLEAAVVGMTPHHLLQPIQYLAAAAAAADAADYDDGFVETWETALLLALLDNQRDSQPAAAHALQQFASTAPEQLLAQVCALLPAAVVNVQAIAAAAAASATDGDDGSSSSSSTVATSSEDGCWDRTSCLLTSLLLTSTAVHGADNSKLRRVCGHLGLYEAGDVRMNGVLQERANACLEAIDSLRDHADLEWVCPQGQDVADWLLQRCEEHQALTEVALRSCIMASYMAMELWYESNGGPLAPYTPDNSGAAMQQQPVVQLSHCQLLQGLWSSHVDIDDLSADILDASGKAQTAALGNYAALTGGLLGALDVASYPEFVDSLQAVQGSMGLQLKAPQLEEMLPAVRQGPAATAAAAVADEHYSLELLDRAVEAMVSGEQVVPLRSYSRIDWLHEMMPEWAAAAQLAVLHSRLPAGYRDELLYGFAAVVDDDSLARVCAVLPIVAVTFCDDTNEYWEDMLNGLLRARASSTGQGATAVDTLLPHFGLQAQAAVAAVRAARAAAASGFEASVDAAVAAVRASGAENVEQTGAFLQLLWREHSKEPVGREDITAVMLCSAAVALTYLLQHCGHAAEGPLAIPAGFPWHSARHLSSEQLPFEGWTAFAAQFISHVPGDSPERAAVAALLQQGVFAAQARQNAALPAALRVNLLRSLRAPPQLRDNSQPRRDPLRFSPVPFEQSGKGSVTLVTMSDHTPAPINRRSGSLGVSEPADSKLLETGLEKQQQQQQQPTDADPSATPVAAETGASDDEQYEVGRYRLQGVKASSGLQLDCSTAIRAAEAASQWAFVLNNNAECISSNETNNSEKNNSENENSSSGSNKSQQAAVEEGAQGVAGTGTGTAHVGARTSEEVLPTVKQILGLPVDPADASSSRSHPDQVPNRLALLMCQAMLMRGDDAQQKLEAAVGYLATCELHRGSHALRLPAMLAGCMEALFAAEDWDSPSGGARQVLSSLASALPSQGYMALQQHLMAKGLTKELEVPADFD